MNKRYVHHPSVFTGSAQMAIQAAFEAEKEGLPPPKFSEADKVALEQILHPNDQKNAERPKSRAALLGQHAVQRRTQSYLAAKPLPKQEGPVVPIGIFFKNLKVGFSPQEVH